MHLICMHYFFYIRYNHYIVAIYISCRNQSVYQNCNEHFNWLNYVWHLMTDFVKAVVSAILYKLKMSIGMPQNYSSVPKCVTHDVCFFFFAAAWRALRDSFPGKPIKGCVFHWNQAVWRHVQQIGLSATYQQREGMYDYIRQLMALPFLPARHIQQTFDHLKTKANTEQLQRLVDYIDRQWFHHPVFDVPSWCVFQQTVRTNNDVEGTKINSMNCGMFSKSYSFSPEMLA